MSETRETDEGSHKVGAQAAAVTYSLALSCHVQERSDGLQVELLSKGCGRCVGIFWLIGKKYEQTGYKTGTRRNVRTFCTREMTHVRESILQFFGGILHCLSRRGQNDFFVEQ